MYPSKRSVIKTVLFSIICWVQPFNTGSRMPFPIFPNSPLQRGETIIQNSGPVMEPQVKSHNHLILQRRKQQKHLWVHTQRLCQNVSQTAIVKVRKTVLQCVIGTAPQQELLATRATTNDILEAREVSGNLEPMGSLLRDEAGMYAFGRLNSHARHTTTDMHSSI